MVSHDLSEEMIQMRKEETTFTGVGVASQRMKEKARFRILDFILRSFSVTE